MSAKRWSKRLAIGMDEVDREHEEIHRLIGLLQDALRTGNRNAVQREIVQTVLNQVLTFAGHHFAYEERLMKRVHFPEYDEHKNEHDLFLRQLRDLKGQLQSGEAPLTSETMNALSNWLHHHVLGTDSKYVPYLLSSSEVKRNVRRDGSTTSRAGCGQSAVIPFITPGSVVRRERKAND